MKTYDVRVTYTDGTEEYFPKIHFVTNDQGVALRLDVKAHTSLPHDTDLMHIASIPYTAMRKWKVVEVS